MVVGWKDSTIATVGPSNHRAAFAYSDTDTITIGGGSYFHDGTTRQTVLWDAALTFDLGSGGTNALSDNLGANEIHYIYLDDSAIVTKGGPELDNTCFLNDTTGPTWSHSKHGWYGNTVDRCIFAVNTNASNQVVEFNHDGGDLVELISQTQMAAAATPSNTYTDVDMAAGTPAMPGFATKASVTFKYAYSNAANDLYYRPNGSSGTGHLVTGLGTTEGEAWVVRSVFTDSAQVIEIKTSSASTNTVTVYYNGYYLPNGM
jgi:hypothetical protein